MTFVAPSEEFESALKPGRYESQFRIRLDEGRSRVVRAMGRAYVSSNGSTKVIGVAWDVTSDVALTEDLQRSKALTEARNADLEAARARIEYNALHDFLTRLPNRMYMDRALEENARRCATTGGGVVLLHIDLDGFKQINDTLGHAAGDAMLIHSAKVIRDNIRDGDFVARTGGDEFVVLCKADAGIAGFDALARRIIASGREPILYEGHECRLGMSIGIAGAFGGAVDRRQLLVNADLALYRAKSLGRNRFRVLHRGAARGDPELQTDRRRHRARAGAGRVHCLLPAAVRRADLSDRRRRSARAVAPPNARPRAAERIHSDRGGADRDRRDRSRRA